jgi:hypothetical protein
MVRDVLIGSSHSQGYLVRGEGPHHCGRRRPVCAGHARYDVAIEHHTELLDPIQRQGFCVLAGP